MRLDTKAIALAAGGVGALWFVICALFVAIAPDATAAVIGFVLHYPIAAPRPLSLGSFIGGLLLFSAWIAAFFGLIGWLYNRLEGGTQPVRTAEPRTAVR